MRLLVSLLLLHGVALADPPLSSADRIERARAHFEMGRAHFNLGEYDAAVREFEEGYRLKPQPLFLYNIANAARRAGQSKKALEMFRRYLSEQPNAVEKREVQQRIAELEQQLKSEPPPPSPAPEPPLPTPSPEPLPPSPEPLPTTPITPEPVTPEAVTPSPEPEVQPLQLRPSPPHRDWRRDWLGPTLISVGGAAVIAGGVELGLHVGAYNDWVSASTYQTRLDAYPAARDAVPHLDAGVWLVPIGAVLIVAGAVRYIILAKLSSTR
jgi:tetratricopeptide (TPR) repeat protein